MQLYNDNCKTRYQIFNYLLCNLNIKIETKYYVYLLLNISPLVLFMIGNNIEVNNGTTGSMARINSIGER